MERVATKKHFSPTVFRPQTGQVSLDPQADQSLFGDGKTVPAGTRDRLRVDGRYFALGERRLRTQGVTYGPFKLNAQGEPFPSVKQVLDDFHQMREAGINCLRTYHLPPEWFLRLADEKGMGLLLDVPWPKHVCFLESRKAQEQARAGVRTAAERGRDHPSVWAYSVCNEIPPSIVRWHGATRIERFLGELHDVAKQADPQGLVTYANYPPTEYLDLSFLDFATFNVYLHDRETFRRYLFRLQNLVGDKPLLLGEIGMDTMRQGVREQAGFLFGHLREAVLAGLAGAFIFAWTDDWHTGGFAIEDWAFGITDRERNPKASYHAIAKVFQSAPVKLLKETPRVSVIVCSYNGGQTLDQCLRSLLRLNYPDYEIIVVNDGSTDDTEAILAQFPQVCAIHQANHGLSYSRNVGLRAATGSVIAYTDSDCYVDPDWLTHLVDQLEHSGAAAVGGPNLSPEDGWMAACVAAAPGQPMHVLESEQVAEHIPGCNMAFRREALRSINGFDSQYRKAGDDVDVCWRLQQAGMWITFAPGAFVWHHRRQTPCTYFKQQAGYGEAEALLRFKHPDKFNGRGNGKWRGVLYGPSLQGLRLQGPIIYRGTFGTGLFQCLYEPGPAHWAMLPSTLEWHLLAGGVALAALLWGKAAIVAALMVCLSVLVASLSAMQARLRREHDGFLARLLVAGLCYAQPLVRSWQRYYTRFFAYRPPRFIPHHLEDVHDRLPLRGYHQEAFWTEEGYDRTELLGLVLAYLNEHGWGKTVDSGWADWDVEVYCHPWTVVQVSSAQEDHGSNHHLLRVRYRMRASGYMKALAVFSTAAAIVAAASLGSEKSVGALLLLGLSCAGWVACCGAWWRGTYRAMQVPSIFAAMAKELGMIRCPASRGPEVPRAADQADAETVPMAISPRKESTAKHSSQPREPSDPLHLAKEFS